MALTKEEKKWQADSDARTLAEAEVINADSGRLTAVKSAAKRLSKEAVATANGFRVVAGSTSGDFT